MFGIVKRKAETVGRRASAVVTVVSDLAWRDQLAEAVSGDDRVTIIHESEGPEGLTELLSKTFPDLLLLQVEPTENPIGRITELRHEFPRMKIVAVSSISHPDFAEIVLRSGAAGFCTFSDDPCEVAAALVDVAGGHVHVSEFVLRQPSRNLRIRVQGRVRGLRPGPRTGQRAPRKRAPTGRP